MKYVKFSGLLILLVGICYALNTPIKAGDATLPPLGKFFSPVTGFWQNAESISSKKSFDISHTNLKGKVSVIFDERDVPHIFADNLEDAVFAQGYLHARDRLFQMDIASRSAAGRLSELLGQRTVGMDQVRRQMGIEYSSEKSIATWKEFPHFDQLENYRDGVNKYIENLSPNEYPIEYKLLGCKPSAWTILKTSLFQKNMALTLAAGNRDVQSSNLVKHFGTEVFNELYPEWNPKQSPIIPSTKSWDGFAADIQVDEDFNKSLSYHQTPPIPKAIPGVGSNNWAVAAEKTKNGNAILCNDPHLMLTLPSIWYEVHIKTTDSNVYGVSLPGIPGVVIGFNEKVAWGVTNVGHDVLDWYKIKWLDDTQTKYEIDGKIHQVEYRVEKIKVKGQADIVDSIKYTKWGPVIPDDSRWKNPQGLAMRWLVHDKPDRAELHSFLDLSTASNYEEIQSALAKYIAPAQNFVYATIAGDVGIKVNGQLPIKDDQNGRFIKDGSSSANGWKGFIPRDELPADYKPERGFVSSANQHSTAPDYPYYYNGGFENYRGRILNDKLEAMNNITVEDMKKLHQNSESYKAKDVLPLFLNLLDRNNISGVAQQILTELEQWNYSYDVNSKAASYFDVWFDNLYDLTFDEVSSLKKDMAVNMPGDWLLVQKLETDIYDKFFDITETKEIENGKGLLQKAFQQMYNQFDSIEQHEWTKFRPRRIEHIASIPAFSVYHVEAPGHGDVLNAYNEVWGPSWRMVVEMDENGINAHGVFPGGQSGNPGSPYYKTGIESWSKGEYFKLKFVDSPNELADDSKYSITFSKS